MNELGREKERDSPDLIRLHVVLCEVRHKLKLVRQRLAELEKGLEAVLPASR
jgi:hypothetical protein